MTIKTLHRYISLVFAALWFFQAATGCLVVFRWELSDATIPKASAPFNAKTMGAKLDALAAQPGTKLSSVWANNADANRFELSYSKDGHDRNMRIDGAGNVIRDRADSGSIWDKLSDLHMALMVGDPGRFFLGFSGLLLLSNLGLGLKMAWPRTGTWLKALRLPPKAKGLPALFYGWHRMLGLWLAVPAMITICAGVGLAYEDPIAALFKAGVPSPAHDDKVTAHPIRPSQALDAVIQVYPGATLSGFDAPGDGESWYKIRLHAPGEMPRLWGMTTLYVGEYSGKIDVNYNARQAHSPARFFLDLVYPLHTGQIGSVFGRCVQLLIGLWLMTMIALGIGLW